jgi:UDP-N-acetyl-2-amino-2-deoxyglucuronate dehydrogenase
MDPVKFAVVGLGMGRNRSRMTTETEGAELAMVVDLDEERARAVGEELGVPWALDIEEALSRDDIECIFVMTPSGTHVDVALQAVAANKNVITTKPMDVSTSACDRLIDACDKQGVHLLVDFQSRYVDGNLATQRAVQEGWLGRPMLGEFRFKWYRSQAYYDDRGGWRGTWDMDGGGSLANQGIHGLDLLMWVMGDIKAVYAEIAVLNHDIETEDTGVVIFDFANGSKGAVTSTTTFPCEEEYEAGGGAYYSFEVHGDKGGIFLHDALGGTGEFMVAEDVKKKIEAVVCPRKNIIDDAVHVIRHGAAPVVDGREGRKSVALLEAIYQSAREGRKVAL